MFLGCSWRKGVITAKLFDEPVRLVKLRNLFVHKYWVIDDRRIYMDVRRDFRCVEGVLKEGSPACWRRGLSTTS
jgi:uncharacterized protein YutE (UPF0331/DUF86 family)